MTDQGTTRGRGGRGRSSSKSRGFRGKGPTGFFDRETRQQAATKLDQQGQQMEEVLETSAQIGRDRRTNPDQSAKQSKISSIVDKGKSFISKHFMGFAQKERGNVKVELDYHFPLRTTDCYLDAITTHVQTQKYEPEDEIVGSYYNKLLGMTCIATAVKLYKSSTENERNLNHRLISARMSEIPLPKNLNAVINQLGKTDLPCDNHIRIRNQWMHVKKFLFLGIVEYLGWDEVSQYMNGRYAEHVDNVKRIFSDENWLDQMIDNTTGSIELLKEYGKKFFELAANTNLPVTMGDISFHVRIPSFDFTGTVTVEKIVAYLNNDLFRKSDILDEGDIMKLVASLVLQVVQWKWLRNKEKTLSELDPAWKDTLIKDITLEEIYDTAKVWNIEDIIDLTTLDELCSESIHRWKTGDLQVYSSFLNLEEMRFSEYGTDAQLIEVHSVDKEYDNRLGKFTFPILGNTRATTKLKTTESGAIFGLMCKFSKKVDISSDFDLKYDSRPVNILKEFLRKDVK